MGRTNIHCRPGEKSQIFGRLLAACATREVHQWDSFITLSTPTVSPLTDTLVCSSFHHCFCGSVSRRRQRTTQKAYADRSFLHLRAQRFMCGQPEIGRFHIAQSFANHKLIRGRQKSSYLPHGLQTRSATFLGIF